MGNAPPPPSPPLSLRRRGCGGDLGFALLQLLNSQAVHVRLTPRTHRSRRARTGKCNACEEGAPPRRPNHRANHRPNPLPPQALTAIGQAHDTTVHWSEAEATERTARHARAQHPDHGAATHTSPSPSANGTASGFGAAAGGGGAAADGAGLMPGGALPMDRNASDVSALAAASGRMTIQPDRPSKSSSKSLPPYAAGGGSAAAGGGGVLPACKPQHQRPTSLDQAGFGDITSAEGFGTGGGGGSGSGSSGGGGGGGGVKWVSWLYISGGWKPRARSSVAAIHTQQHECCSLLHVFP